MEDPSTAELGPVPAAESRTIEVADRSGGSKDSPVASRTATAVSDLPDLTGRLIKEGLHEEYLQYRARYLMWRRGGASGAVGELGELGTVRTGRRQGVEAHAQEIWHPTPQKFDFFYTVSYWVAIVFTVGSLLLTFSNLAPLFGMQGAIYTRVLRWIDVTGDLCFTIGTYLAYFELINTEDSGRLIYFFPSWATVKERVSLESQVGVVCLFVAMLVWDIPAALDLVDVELSGLADLLLRELLTFLGGLGFLIGGICEVIHNWSRSARDVEWWASFGNFLGGGCFCIGGAAGAFVDSDSHFPGICFSVGLILYTVTSILLMLMWKSNDFGLTLLRQLNTSLRVGAPISISHTAEGLRIRQGAGLPRLAREALPRPAREALPPPRDNSGEQEGGGSAQRLSMRGVVFLVIYCWLFAVCFMNCLAGLYMDSGGPVEHILRFIWGILWLFVVAIVLTVHSSLTSVPNQQPYRLAMLVMRGTLFFAAVVQTLIFTRWLRHIKHPSWIDA